MTAGNAGPVADGAMAATAEPASPLPVIGYIDRPALASLAGSRVTVDGWVAAGQDIREVRISVDDCPVEIATPYRRPDVRLPHYSDSHVTGYRLSRAVVLPNEPGRDVAIRVRVSLASGQSADFSLVTHLEASVEAAITFIEQKMTGDPCDYLKLALDLYDADRKHDLDILLQVTKRKFPGANPMSNVMHLRQLEREIDAPSKLRPADPSNQAPSAATLRQLEPEIDAPVRVRPGGTGDQAASVTAAPSEFMLNFESLGWNCEFGLVQRHFGSEPLGLLRFATSRLSVLIAALGSRFEGVGSWENTILYPGASGTEYVWIDRSYGFASHTFIPPAKSDDGFEVIFGKHCRRLAFLKDKLLSDIERAEKIFVYYTYERLSDDDIRQLFEALQQIGPATLLCVRPKENGRIAGSVDVIGPRLAVADIAKFSVAEDVPNHIDFASWREICEKASLLLTARG